MVTVSEKWAVLSQNERNTKHLEIDIQAWREEYRLDADNEEITDALDNDERVGLEVETVQVEPEWVPGSVFARNDNFSFWVKLFKGYDRILGEFPPEALESLAYLRESARRGEMYDGFKIGKDALALRGRVWAPVVSYGEVVRWAQV